MSESDIANNGLEFYKTINFKHVYINVFKIINVDLFFKNALKSGYMCCRNLTYALFYPPVKDCFICVEEHIRLTF
jgi:hypothetical protein